MNWARVSGRVNKPVWFCLEILVEGSLRSIRNLLHISDLPAKGRYGDHCAMGTAVRACEGYVRCEVWSCSSFMKVGGSLDVFTFQCCTLRVPLILSEH